MSNQDIVDLMNENARLKERLASARKALGEARRFCDEEMGPSRGSLLYKIANIIDAELTDEEGKS